MAVEFEESTMRSTYIPHEPKGFAKFVIEHSKGKIQNETQASIVLIGFIVFMVILSIVFYHFNTPPARVIVPAMPPAVG